MNRTVGFTNLMEGIDLSQAKFAAPNWEFVGCVQTNVSVSFPQIPIFSRPFTPEQCQTRCSEKWNSEYAGLSGQCLCDVPELGANLTFHLVDRKMCRFPCIPGNETEGFCGGGWTDGSAPLNLTLFRRIGATGTDLDLLDDEAIDNEARDEEVDDTELEKQITKRDFVVEEFKEEIKENGGEQATKTVEEVIYTVHQCPPGAIECPYRHEATSPAEVILHEFNEAEANHVQSSPSGQNTSPASQVSTIIVTNTEAVDASDCNGDECESGSESQTTTISNTQTEIKMESQVEATSLPQESGCIGSECGDYVVVGGATKMAAGSIISIALITLLSYGIM